MSEHVRKAGKQKVYLKKTKIIKEKICKNGGKECKTNGWNEISEERKTLKAGTKVENMDNLKNRKNKERLYNTDKEENDERKEEREKKVVDIGREKERKRERRRHR
ncbi:hypothetical protein RUM43_008917 [Polyplax serrata]|uniref:Uncharacterized protein n=1 Tax=Polyplax serrata TaxID=468196 RepID=A0AAN8NNI7_POLSC